MTCAGPTSSRRILDQRLDGVEVEICYPTYTFAGVLCTHGHYLDFHARRSGTAPGRLLARTLWAIAVGGEEHRPAVQDYEATITLLTALLYTIAQLPNGTQAQRRAFAAFEGLERAIRGARAPLRGFEHTRSWITEHVDSSMRAPAAARSARGRRVPGGPLPEEARRRHTGAPTGGEAASHALVRLVHPSDSAVPAVEAIDQVVSNLGWDRETDQIGSRTPIRRSTA